MKIQPLSIPQPELQNLVQQINDRIVGGLRNLSGEDFSPGSVFPFATSRWRIENDGVQYDTDGLPLACTIEVAADQGRWVPWRFEWDWDQDEKVRGMRLLDDRGKVRARWDVLWTWEGSTTYGGEWYPRRVSVRLA